MGKRGVGLGTVLIVVALMVTVGLALSGMSVTHLRLMSQGSNTRQAENLARSVVAQAVEQVLSDPDYDFGEQRLPSESLDIALTGPAEGSTSRLTFSPVRAQEWGIPYSTNNLLGDRSVAGDGKAVPASALHLYGVSESGGKKRTLEALLHVPANPYAIASAGVVEARNGLVVGSLSELPADGNITTPEDLEPADIHSNSMGQAIVLGRDTRIGGDVEAVGTIEIPQDPSVLVGGEVLNNADSVTLLDIDLDRYDPELRSGSFDSYNEGSYSDLTIPGAAKSSGDLTVTGGGLTLDGGLLFVDGDLSVQGGLSGKGILVATGSLTVDGRASTSTESQLAIITGGDFRLQGSGTGRSYLQGVVYTGGDFFAESATLVGALISKGGTDVEDFRLFQHGDQNPVTVSLGATSTSSGPPDFTLTSSTSLAGPTPLHLRFEFEIFEEREVRFTLFENDLSIYTTTTPTTYSTGQSDLAQAVYDGMSQVDTSFLPPRATPILMARADAIINSTYIQWGNHRLEEEEEETEPGSTPSDPQDGEQIIFDPSEFFTVQDRIRVVSWREH